MFFDSGGENWEDPAEIFTPGIGQVTGDPGRRPEAGASGDVAVRLVAASMDTLKASAPINSHIGTGQHTKDLNQRMGAG